MILVESAFAFVRVLGWMWGAGKTAPSSADSVLTDLPDDAATYGSVKTLELTSRQLASLPERVLDLPRLEVLDLSNNQLALLPGRIRDLSQLKALILWNNCLVSLPGEIGDLPLLRRLDLEFNCLKLLPDSVCGLSRLERLDLGFNRLASLPAGIGELKGLRELGAGVNMLDSLPAGLGDLVLLERLDLGHNRLSLFPEEIGRLSRLRELCLNNNQIAVLPGEIGRLSRLRELCLNNNQIAVLPGEIGRLSRLRELHLNNNQIAVLPGEMAGLSRLEKLNLNSNKIESLPLSVAELPNLAVLDLRNNPLSEYGEGDTLGWRELPGVLGDRVLLPPADVLTRVIDEQEVYDKLAAMPLHWNVEKLRTIVIDPVPQHRLEGREILRIWDEISRYAPGYLERTTMRDYIKTMYDIDPDAFRGPWRMPVEFVPETKNLIEAVFVRLGDSADDAEAYVPEMCEAIKHCPDRQMACFNMLYSILHLKGNTKSFEYFVESEIAALKNYVFNMVVTPGEGTQNVHVQNFWKHRLRDKLGFNIEYHSNMGTQDQDRFFGRNGNALDAFFAKFTPRYVVGKLAEEINSRSSRLNDSGSFLFERIQDREYAMRVFEFESEEMVDDMVPAGIKREGVEDILVMMGILERSGG